MMEATSIAADVGVLEPSDRGIVLSRHLLIPRIRAAYDLACTDPGLDEHEAWIHDVRVASRRLVEALDLARPILPDDPRDRVRRRAQRMRRRLGRTRELDVVLRDFENLCTRLDLPECTRQSIRSYVDLKREEAVNAAEAALPMSKRMKQREQALDLTRFNEAPRLAWRDLAARHICSRTEEADHLLDAMAEPRRVEEHHELRIRFKRVRYTVELAERLLEPELELPVVLRHVKRIQDALGILNDAGDMITFVDDYEIRNRLGYFHGPIKDEARRLQRRRYHEAKVVVQDKAPRVLGQLRRASGRIGLFAER